MYSFSEIKYYETDIGGIWSQANLPGYEPDDLDLLAISATSL